MPNESDAQPAENRAAKRRNEILDAALHLFVTQGYDGTSVANILDAVGIAKGTFYYHFPSKEHLMDAIIERFNRAFAERARAIAGDKRLDVVQKLVGVLGAYQMDDPQGQHLVTELHRPQNALMHQKMARSLIASLAPILTEVVEEGRAEGLFDTPYPQQTMQMLVIYIHAVFDEEWVVLDGEQRREALLALAHNLERLLQARVGTFDAVRTFSM